MTTNINAALAEDLQDAVSKALRRAWQLGQTYWQQADSEYTSQHRKADETQGKFDALVEETRAALSTAAQPTASQERGEAIEILVRFAEGRTTHAYTGNCPSDESPSSRDPECMVCWAIDAARAAKKGAKHGNPHN